MLLVRLILCSSIDTRFVPFLGTKVFPHLPVDASFSYKFVSMILACTGGGTLVPIFINSIPVSLSTDAYPIAIMTSLLLHQYFPILREVLSLSPLLKVCTTIATTIRTAADVSSQLASHFRVFL